MGKEIDLIEFVYIYGGIEIKGSTHITLDRD